MPQQTHQLAAIMFTDIVGYTALMDKDEEAAFAQLEKNRSIQKPLIKKFHGKFLKEMGDGILASFSTVTDAVYCAGSIQQACDNEADLKLRIGIHQGEVVYQGEDVFGSGVNIASRIEAIAPIGGIWVSDSVQRNIQNKKGIEIEFIKEETLKNVKQPVRLYEVKVNTSEIYISQFESFSEPERDSIVKSKRKLPFIIAIVTLLIIALGYFAFSRFEKGNESVNTSANSVITEKSIAVLPFRNDSPDPDNEYFCNGMVEEILNHLQKISALKVKSRTSGEQYRNPSRDIKAIAKELEVAFVIEGSVRKFGDDLRITAQLIEAKTGDHIWSETYDGKYTDKIFEFQSDVAKQIASSLNVIITPNEEERIDKIPTKDIAAYDLLIKGAYELDNYWSAYDKKHLKTAHDLFDRALQIDPEYLKAIQHSGNAFLAEGNYDSAFIYADRILALDPEFGGAYALKGVCYFVLGKSDLAIENYLKAIDLPPRDDDWLWYHVELGREYLWQKNDVIKALPYFKKGLESEESKHLSDAYWFISESYLAIGDYERAEAYLRKGMELGGCGVNMSYSWWLLVQGKFQDALQFTESKCQQLDCEWSCYRRLFEASLLLEEYEKAEEYFIQYTNAPTLDVKYDLTIDYQIAYVYYQIGKTEEARLILTEQIQKIKSWLNKEKGKFYSQMVIVSLARIYAFQGDRSEALKYLNEYAKQGFEFGWHDFILIDPFFESLRDDPEFKAIVKQAQEEKAALRAQIREMEERGELDL